jgi:hypothetical protein
MHACSTDPVICLCISSSVFLRRPSAISLCSAWFLSFFLPFRILLFSLSVSENIYSLYASCSQFRVSDRATFGCMSLFLHGRGYST